MATSRGAETPASIVALPVADEVAAYTDAQAVAAVATALNGGSETIGVTYDPQDSTNPLYLFLRSLAVKLSHLSSEVKALLLSPDQKAALPAGASATNPLALKSDIPEASSAAGNLYASTGQNTDGAMTQRATTNALAAKADQVVMVGATVALRAGQLVARLGGGVVPYDAQNLTHRHALLGVSLVATPAGGVGPAQVAGIVQVAGWGLSTDTVYAAGADGSLTSSDNGLAFLQIIGRAISTEELLFSPQFILKINE